jgi:DNA repair exonuclease SbcCD ATPase subunit
MPRTTPDYSKGIIYKICCKDPEVTDVYVGSTICFRKRKYTHKSDCKKRQFYVYQFIRENGGWNNWEMIEVERYQAIDKQDLLKRERHWLEELKASLNREVPSRTVKEYMTKYREENKEKIIEYYKENKEKIKEREAKYREQNKEVIKEKRKKYYEENKEAIKERDKKYREENKEKEAERHRKYYEENKEKEAERLKKYYEKNKEQIKEQSKKYKEENKEKMKEKYTCECGSLVRKDSKNRHERTQKHRNFKRTSGGTKTT